MPAQLDDSRHPCCATFQEAARRNVRVFAPPPCACLGAHRSISEQFHSRHVLLRKSHRRASREARVDAPGKSPCCDARRRTSETPVVGVRVVRRAWLRHSAARNSGTHNFEDHRCPLSPPVVGGVLLLFLVDGAHQRNQQVQQHLHAEHMSDAVGRSNSRAVQHGLQYSALP